MTAIEVKWRMLFSAIQDRTRRSFSSFCITCPRTQRILLIEHRTSEQLTMHSRRGHPVVLHGQICAPVLSFSSFSSTTLPPFPLPLKSTDRDSPMPLRCKVIEKVSIVKPASLPHFAIVSPLAIRFAAAVLRGNPRLDNGNFRKFLIRLIGGTRKILSKLIVQLCGEVMWRKNSYIDCGISFRHAKK